MLTNKEVNAMHDDLVEKFYPKPSYSFCFACRVVAIGYVSWDFAKDLEGSGRTRPRCREWLSYL